MTDEEMADFLGFAAYEPKRLNAVRSFSPEKRRLFERMAAIEIELALWEDGLGPKPSGVIVCREHRHGEKKR